MAKKMKNDATSSEGAPVEPCPPEAIEAVADATRLRGCYANIMSSAHTAEEFVFDFFLRIGEQPAQMVARIITSPTHAKAIRDVLTTNIGKYELEHGQIEQKERPKHLEVGAHELRLLAALVAASASLPLTVYRGQTYAAAKKNLLRKNLVEHRLNRFHLTEIGLEVFKAHVAAKTVTRRNVKATE